MNNLKKLLKIGFWLIILGLLIAPLFCIWRISNFEMRQYDVPDAPILVETAYGGITHAFRKDMWETMEVSGDLVSVAYEDVLINCDQPNLIHWSIEVGSEVEVGQVVGTFQGEELLSSAAGIVDQIHMQRREECYLRIRQYSPLLLRSDLTQSQVVELTSAKELTLTDGTPISIVWQAHRQNPDGTTSVELSLNATDYKLGQILRSVRIKTDSGDVVVLSGELVSNTFEEILVDCSQPSLIHWCVEIGSEIEEGQVIGTYLGRDIISTSTGILEQINYQSREDCYMRIQLYSPLVLRCNLSQKQLFALTSAPELTLTDGNLVSIVNQNHRRNSDGTTTVDLSFDMDGFAIGQHLENIKVKTGRGYPQALVVDERCVYQKTVGEDEPWFVRQVSEDGYFIQELEVKVGYAADGLICISGIEEDMFFDTGYKALLTGSNT